MALKLSVSETQEALRIQVEEAVQVLRVGGVVAIPTDTVYGLAAASNDESAIRRIYRIKGRPTDLAMPLLLNKFEGVCQYASDVPDTAWELARSFWPGPLTIVFQKDRSVSNLLTAEGDTVGLRVPDHWVPRTLAKKLGVAITGTSANRSGWPSATSAAEVVDQLSDDIDLVVDGGTTAGPISSTVIRVSESFVRILREGPITRRDMEDVLGGGLRIL